MPRIQYFVLKDGETWKILYNGRAFTGYETRDAAFRAAVDAAQRAGRPAQVLVQGRYGWFRPEWTYAQDPYPPAT